MSIVDLARGIAFAAHAGQRDQAEVAYILHPQAVAAAVAGQYTFDRDSITGAQRDLGAEAVAVAWLHDVLEDTKVTVADLRMAGLPESVVRAVEVITHRPHEPREEYYDRVLTDRLALVVKIADIRHNLGRVDDLGRESTRERLRTKYRAALEYLNGDKEALK